MSPNDSREIQLAHARQARASTIAFRQLFGSPEGKKILDHLVKKFAVMKPTYVKGDTHESAFNEGQRNVLLYILTRVNTNPDDYNAAIQAAMSKEPRHV